MGPTAPPAGGPPRAVVFGYHNVGVRCLQVLLAHGVDVPLVVTHRNEASENTWFESVQTVAELNAIAVAKPHDPNTSRLAAQVASIAPDFIFSFYYRHLLGSDLLRLATGGAWNMHGSLLPRYRGRAPVNWAVLDGERETGASLHRMLAEPDAGALAGWRRVPILPNDTAGEVMHKVTGAAECLLDEILPGLLAGELQETVQPLTGGQYFGRRRPQDGLIDWGWSAQRVHNLIRAVAPPYPGAFFNYRGHTVMLLGSHYRARAAAGTHPGPCLYWEGGACYADCADGRRVRLLDVRIDNESVDATRCERMFGCTYLPLPILQES